MTRTTLDLDPSVLRDLKTRAAEEGKTLGQLVSELLVGPLAEPERTKPREFHWISKDMGLRLDLEDKEAVRRAVSDPDHP
ncbi:MAG: antitoxin [Chloroflexota bacterium]